MSDDIMSMLLLKKTIFVHLLFAEVEILAFPNFVLILHVYQIPGFMIKAILQKLTHLPVNFLCNNKTYLLRKLIHEYCCSHTAGRYVRFKLNTAIVPDLEMAPVDLGRTNVGRCFLFVV